VDFARDMDPNAALTDGTSPYMKDLSDKILFVREAILAQLHVGDLMREWCGRSPSHRFRFSGPDHTPHHRVLDLCRYVLQTFVLHASLIKPLSESGKLKLTSDMTLLEFSVNQFLSEHKLNLAAIGDDFKALRSFRLVSERPPYYLLGELTFLLQASALSRDGSIGGPASQRGYPRARPAPPRPRPLTTPPTAPSARVARSRIRAMGWRAFRDGPAPVGTGGRRGLGRWGPRWGGERPRRQGICCHSAHAPTAVCGSSINSRNVNVYIVFLNPLF
jgi:hypothetical protein